MKSIVELHVVQLSGLAVFPYATCTAVFHASLGHVVVNVTLVHVVYVASVLIVNVPFVGGVLSITNCPLVLVVSFAFHALSTADHESIHR